MKKLSPKMQEVLDLMAQGWELAYSSGWYSDHTWLQKGGAGKGGSTKTVSANTRDALLRRGLIEMSKEELPFVLYRLVPKPTD